MEDAQPASFVLASLFNVEAMSLDIPDHILESDPLLEWVTCPCCDGEKWLEVEGNGWTHALFSDPRQAYAYRALNYSYVACTRCGGHGEVLEPHHALKSVLVPVTPVEISRTWLLAA